jgi:hypothetical protein
MGTALICVLISIWLGMAAAIITVLQVSYSRRKHLISDKERFMHEWVRCCSLPERWNLLRAEPYTYLETEIFFLASSCSQRAPDGHLSNPKKPTGGIMRFNEKSDVQKHFSKKYRPTFLHESNTESHAPKDRTDIPRHAEPGADAQVVRVEESGVHTS